MDGPRKIGLFVEFVTNDPAAQMGGEADKSGPTNARIALCANGVLADKRTARDTQGSQTTMKE
jgi:hypothetical protein